MAEELRRIVVIVTKNIESNEVGCAVRTMFDFLPSVILAQPLVRMAHPTGYLRLIEVGMVFMKLFKCYNRLRV